MVKGLIGLENLSGPITIAKVAGQSAEMDGRLYLIYGFNECKSWNFKFIANSNA